MSSTWSHATRVAYMTLSQPTWAVAVSWIIFACATGYGGYINSILSWEGWLPMSRLTYSVFLVHLTIMLYEQAYIEFTILYTVTSLTYNIISYFGMALAVGFILTVTVESPMLVLEKVILG